MARTFKQVAKTKHSKRQSCSLCGKPIAGMVQVRLYDDTTGAYRTFVKSKTLSFCETHAVELFENFAGILSPNGDAA